MPDPLRKAPARAVFMVIAAVAAVVAIGFATGTAPRTYRAEQPPLRERPEPGKIPPARSHAELERRPWEGGVDASGWATSKEIASETALRDEREDVPAEEAVLDRAARRAFDGAPPVIPHPVRASGAAECLACHADGFTLGRRSASRVPHAEYASCTQCHVTDSALFTVLTPNPAASAALDWRGLRSPTSGAEAYMGAPPSVPHPTWMRENCESCHGPEGRAALRTPHPDRRSCLQCHPSEGALGLRASR